MTTQDRQQVRPARARVQVRVWVQVRVQVRVRVRHGQWGPAREHGVADASAASDVSVHEVEATAMAHA
jgi:hypothetical protein